MGAINSMAVWLGLGAVGLAFSEIPRQYLAIPIGFFVFSIVSIDTNIEEAHRTHTHAADGSINGIRGWY
tara:strand:- start:364 stop:570 length:207 start_codon:yes stop_codon:yes gene_type:complete